MTSAPRRSTTVTGSVTTAASNQEFIDSTRTEATDIFSFGVLTFTGGGNNGLSIEVKEYALLPSSAGGKFILVLPMPFSIVVGNSYSLSKGCDKTTQTCHNRFSNIVNFRGEPSVPGLDRMLETAGTRSTW